MDNTRPARANTFLDNLSVLLGFRSTSRDPPAGIDFFFSFNPAKTGSPIKAVIRAYQLSVSRYQVSIRQLIEHFRWHVE